MDIIYCACPEACPSDQVEVLWEDPVRGICGLAHLCPGHLVYELSAEEAQRGGPVTNTDNPIPQLDFLVPRSQRVQEFLQAADQRLANLKHTKAGLEELAERREQEIYLELIDSGQAPAKNAESRKAQLSKALWENKPYRDIRAQLDQQLVAVSNEEVKLRALEREWRWLLVMLEVKMAQERGRVVQVEARMDSRPPVTQYVPWADSIS